MNISDINAYKEKCGVRAAADLLLLMGPDAFEGDYDATMKDLEDEISTAEVEGLKRVADADYYSGGGYCGCFGISQPYPTYADAQASIID